MAKKIGVHTIELESCPVVLGYASAVGKKESEGPLHSYFDIIYPDPYVGEKSFEKAESIMQKNAANKAIEKAALNTSDINFVFAGDLLNQCAGSHYGLRDLNIAFIGLYGACSTMAEALAFAALFVEGGFASRSMAVTSSHFCASERQFRFPLEYGGQRAPTSQWTVTGAGAVVVGENKNNETNSPHIKRVTFGKIIDMGITDINNMGAAMAPSAYETIKTFLKDTGTNPDDYDMILTGDLGQVGSQLLIDLLQKDDIDISKVHNDCGLMIYDINKQDVHAGGSGCGCSASVLCSVIMKRFSQGQLNKILFAATGALMSPTTVQQGESIPGITHLIEIRK